MSWNLDFRKGINGLIFNPVGYMAQHRPLADVVADYYKDHPPGIRSESETEEGFKVKRQQYIDGCAGSVKSTDIGYSLANASRVCAEVFDRDPLNAMAQNSIFDKAEAEKVELKFKIEQNQKNVLVLIFILLTVGIALFIFIRKS